ncbi:hypothetical protein LCGC14_2481600, partial [marine sediment metagenome]
GQAIDSLVGSQPAENVHTWINHTIEA